jgi:hypothetical protein
VAAGPGCNAAAATGYPTIASFFVYVVYASAGSPGEVRRGTPDSAAAKGQEHHRWALIDICIKEWTFWTSICFIYQNLPTYTQPYFDICIKTIEKWLGFD